MQVTIFTAGQQGKMRRTATGTLTDVADSVVAEGGLYQFTYTKDDWLADFRPHSELDGIVRDEHNDVDFRFTARVDNDTTWTMRILERAK